MFYVGIFIVVFVVLDIIYVSYSFSKKKFAFVWPLHVLRILFSLFITIFFLPLFDYFISLLNCVYDSNGNYVHAYFSNVQCWNGIYILHAVIAIVMSIVFVVICLAVSMTYFECRSTSNDPTSRYNNTISSYLLNSIIE